MLLDLDLLSFLPRLGNGGIQVTKTLGHLPLRIEGDDVRIGPDHVEKAPALRGFELGAQCRQVALVEDQTRMLSGWRHAPGRTSRSHATVNRGAGTEEQTGQQHRRRLETNR